MTLIVKISRTVKKPSKTALIIQIAFCIIWLAQKYLCDILLYINQIYRSENKQSYKKYKKKEK